MELTAALAGVCAATFTRGMAIGAGFAAIVFTVFIDVVAFGDFAFAVRAGAWGSCIHSGHI